MQIDESQEIYLYHRPQRWTLWTLKTCHRVLHNFQEHRPSYLRFFIINISTRFPVFCKALHIGWKYSWVQKDEYRLQKSTSIYIYKMVRLYKYIDAGHRLQNSMYMCIVYIQLCIYTMVRFRSTLSWCWPMVRGQSTKHPKVWTFHCDWDALGKYLAISCNLWKS